MSEKDAGFEVDPEDLRRLAGRFVDAAGNASDAFDRHHAEVADQSSTLFGATRAALSGKVDTWRDTAAMLTGAVHGHGRELHSGAVVYREVDHGNGGDIADARNTRP